MDDHADFEKDFEIQEIGIVFQRPRNQKPCAVFWSLELQVPLDSGGLNWLNLSQFQLSWCLSPHWTKVTLDHGCNLWCFQS